MMRKRVVQLVLFKMEYNIQIWRISEFLELYNSNRLILSPPYQRNFIWTSKDQKELIDSILIKGFPVPSIFVRQTPNGLYEVVDGQQRLRTIFSYYENHFNNRDGLFTDEMKDKFLSYSISVTIINDADQEGAIEEFYARVNKTGRKLNKPELAKAEFFNTRYLILNEELARDATFQNLNLFTDSSTNRMNDVDLVSELTALLFYGVYDKKERVDDLYTRDILAEEKDVLKARFLNILRVISQFNNIYPIKNTRYRQRNDFFTLFEFIDKYTQIINEEDFEILYKVLIAIDEDIAPSNDFCEPFKDYAINCITQSNSKRARLNRFAFFESVLVNESSQPNFTQSEILDFYELESSNMISVGNYYTLNFQAIFELKEIQL